MRLARFALASLALLLPALGACSRNALIDFAMTSAYRAPLAAPARADAPSARDEPAGTARGAYLLLAGDMHCHVRPPDPPWHVDRELPETLRLAREERLDFLVLTPHVRARFFADAAQRDAFARAHRELEDALARAPADGVVVIPGLEYTDYQYGHLSLGFADLDAVLADVPLDEARAHPERFIERWVARGGLVVVNHPVLTPFPSAFPSTRHDLSWRPFFAPGPFPADIAAAQRVAQGVEVYNLAVTHLRDGLLLEEPARSMRTAEHLAEHEARARGRRVAALGGTDSHGHHLRAVTFLLARARTPDAIREAILAGRTCVRSPEACSLEARADGGAWLPVGASLRGARVEVRADGEPIAVYRNGELVGRPTRGEPLAIDVAPGVCTAIHAEVGEGLSSPIYVGCPF